MSITCLPPQAKVEISPTDPSALTWIGLIQPRPNSPAKKCPSTDCGDLGGEVRVGAPRSPGPPIGDSEPPPNSGGVPASPAYRIQAGRAGGSVPCPVLRNELLTGPPVQLNFGPVALVAKFHSLYVSVAVLVPVQYGHP